MIKLNIENFECHTEIIGTSSDVLKEIFVANLALTSAIEQITGMPYEAASIFLMQQSNKFRAKQKESGDIN